MNTITEKLSSNDLITLEEKHGAHNYHPLEVVFEVRHIGYLKYQYHTNVVLNIY